MEKNKCNHHWLISEDGRSGVCKKCSGSKEFPPNPFELVDTRRLKQAERLAKHIKRITDAQLLLDTLSLEELQEAEYKRYDKEDTENY